MANSVEDKKDEQLEMLVQYYEQYAESSQEARARSERDRDYYDHKQLTPEQLGELQKRKQAPTIINYVQKKVNYLLGVERQTRQDPKAYPRTPAHEDAAHAASDSIKYVCDNNNFDQIASDAYENLLIEGLCGSVIEAKPKALGKFEIVTKRINWDRVFYDSHSREKDFSDCNYKGYIEWKDLKDAEKLAERYGYKGELCEDNEYFGESFEDKPSYQKWYDNTRQRVKLSYVWFMQNGVWMHAVYTKAGIIWGPKESPYTDEDGKPECNFVIQSALVDRDNNRYGYVRAMISQQDAINKRESKSLHLLSQRQTWGKTAAFKDANRAKLEFAKPDGHVEVNDHAEYGKDFGLFDTSQMAVGQMQLLQEAKRDLDTVASTGEIGGAPTQSGRALEARAQSGNIELTPFTDAHKMWKKRVYRCIWNKVRQFWDSEMWVRVTDDENNLQWVGLNAPVTMAEQLIMQQTGLDLPEVKKQFGPQIEQAIMQNPALGQVAEVQNSVAELDVDIIIDEAPDVINLQAEQFQIIANIAERRGDIPTNLLIKMSSIRNKEQILDELEGDDQQKEAAAQAQQVAQQVQLESAQAKTASDQARAMKDRAQAEKTNQEAIQKMLENAALQIYQPQPNLTI